MIEIKEMMFSSSYHKFIIYFLLMRNNIVFDLTNERSE